MISDSIRHAAELARLISAVLLAAAALRFAGFSITRVIEKASAAPSPVAVAVAVPPRKTPISQVPLPSASLSHPKQDPKLKAQAGSPIRISLMVSAGPPRSEVRINGVTVGRSPFLGDVSCKAGERIIIEIAPAGGPSRRIPKRCVPGTLRVED